PVEIAVRGSEHEVVLTISDAGPGIPESEWERIFRRFERAAPMRNFGGLGLGLYVARQIVEAHGGGIPPAPLPPPGAPLRHPPRPPPARGGPLRRSAPETAVGERQSPMSHTVLVVEDDADIRQALLEILEEHGFNAAGVKHGAEALQFLTRATELPCLILLD